MKNLIFKKKLGYLHNKKLLKFLKYHNNCMILFHIESTCNNLFLNRVKIHPSTKRKNLSLLLLLNHSVPPLPRPRVTSHPPSPPTLPPCSSPRGRMGRMSIAINARRSFISGTRGKQTTPPIRGTKAPCSG